MIPLILASNSPRRRQLLEQIGLSFRVITAEVAEDLPAGCDLAAGVREVARRKAEAVASRVKEGLVLGADTLVVLNGEALGKPAGPQEAFNMLTRLQGREHQVITGVALVDAASGACLLEHELTRVWMRIYTPGNLAVRGHRGAPGQGRSLRHPGKRCHAGGAHCWLLFQCGRLAPGQGSGHAETIWSGSLGGWQWERKWCPSII